MEREKITEAMIIAYLQHSGGYSIYQKAIDDLSAIREAAISMINIHNGDVEKAIAATKEGQKKIIERAKKMKK